MRPPFVITSDYPTAEEVGRRLGVSPERTAELIKMADAIVAELRAEDRAKAAKRRSKRKELVKK